MTIFWICTAFVAFVLFFVVLTLCISLIDMLRRSYTIDNCESWAKLLAHGTLGILAIEFIEWMLCHELWLTQAIFVLASLFLFAWSFFWYGLKKFNEDVYKLNYDRAKGKHA